MNFFVGAFLVAQTILQITNSQVIRNVASPLVSPCGNPVINPCGCSGPIINPCGYSGPIINPCTGPIISPCDPYGVPMVAPTVYQSNSVAASLADTLSLLTVSSLLADILPLGGCGCGGYNCGCGCGYGYGGYC